MEMPGYVLAALHLLILWGSFTLHGVVEVDAALHPLPPFDVVGLLALSLGVSQVLVRDLHVHLGLLAVHVAVLVQLLHLERELVVVAILGDEPGGHLVLGLLVQPEARLLDRALQGAFEGLGLGLLVSALGADIQL